MKVVVNIVVDVDVQAYRDEYNEPDTDIADIRDDIRYRALEGSKAYLDSNKFSFVKDMWLK
jgi:hypothetical protein